MFSKPLATQNRNTSPFAAFPPELIALIIQQGAQLSLPNDLSPSHQSAMINAKQIRSFLRRACLTSSAWNYLAQRHLLERPYLFGEFAVTEFLDALSRNKKDDQVLTVKITKVELRMRGKHGDTSAMEKLLDGVEELKELVIDGGEEGYSKLNRPQQDKWLRKANHLTSLSLHHVAHLLESTSTSDSPVTALSLPNLTTLSITTTNQSQSTLPLLAASPNLVDLTLVDKSHLDFVALLPILATQSKTLRSLRLNTRSKLGGDQLLAARRIITQSRGLVKLGIDVTAITGNHSLGLGIREWTLFNSSLKKDDETKEALVKIIDDGLKELKLLELPRAISSRELESVCSRRGICLVVV